MNNALNKKLVDIAKKSTGIRMLYRKLTYSKRALVFNAYQKKYPLNEKMVIFEVYHGKKYTCSPKAIYEEMIKEEKFNDFEFIWFFQNTEEYQNIKELEGATLVDYNSKDYYKYYAKAKYIVTNSISVKLGELKKNQVYIQTWHGTPLKRLGFDLETEKGSSTNSLREIAARYREEAKKIDYMISPSAFTSEKLKSSFKLDDYNNKYKMLEVGYPRNDYLATYTIEDIRRIKSELGIIAEEHIEINANKNHDININPKLHLNQDPDSDYDYDTNFDPQNSINILKQISKTNKTKKVILYAPTFRDNSHESGVGFTYDLGFEIDRLQKELGEDFVILFRTHYFVSNTIDLNKYRDFVIDVTNYPEINDLYIVSDMLITDYSSVFFDYANLKKPIIFYMYDLEEYRADIRGFYFDLNELPGEIVQNEQDLIGAIKKVSFEEAESSNHTSSAHCECEKLQNIITNEVGSIDIVTKYKKFNEKFNYLDDGNASKRVIEECFGK